MNLVGKILVATTKIPDRLFRHSIICILAHTEQGASGVILNKNTSQSVTDFWATLENAGKDVNTLKFTSEFVQLGGPVHGPALILHNMEAAGDIKIADGVWCSAKPESLQKIVANAEKARFYHGYSGWVQNQLENEIKSGAWHVLDPANDLGHLVFHEQFETEKIWKKGLGLVGFQVFKSLGVAPEEFNRDCTRN